MHVLLRLLINAAALWVATQLVSGITYTGDGVSLLGVALVFGVLNALMLMLTATASDALGMGFHVAGFLPALKGALVVTIVSFGLSLFVSDSDAPKRKEVRT